MEDEAAAPYVAPIPEAEIEESRQLIEPDGVRLMKGPAGVTLLEHLRPTRPLGLRTLRLTWLAALAHRVLKTLRGWLGGFVPDGPRPRRPP